MKLQELPKEHSLIIQIEWGTRTIEFNTEVIDKDVDGIFVKPYIHQDGPLNLNIDISSGVIVNVYTDNPLTSERLGWKNVSIKTITRGNGICYHLSTNVFNSIASHEERRESERLLVRKTGRVYDALTDTYTDVMVHDVSDIGISFYAPASFDCRSPQPSLTFSDTIDGREYINTVTFSISRTKKNVGTVLYGCRILGDNRNFLIYGFMKKLVTKKESEKGAKLEQDQTPEAQ